MSKETANLLQPKKLPKFAFLTALQGGDEPTSFQEAWNHPDKEKREKWRESIRKELRDLIRRCLETQKAQ